MNKLNIGIIGLGSQGKIHLQNCLVSKQLNVLGVADTSKHSLAYAKRIGVRNAYSNYEDLLKNKELDAVIISLPNFLHLESTVKAAEAGKHIFLEKPISRNLKEGEAIISSANKNGVKLMIGYPMRFDPVLRRVREKIVDGFFGEIEIAEATNVSAGPFTPHSEKGGPSPVPDWWFNKELVGGGVLLDLGVHLIDLFTWYFGDVENVSSHLGYTFNMELEDLAVCAMRFKKGPIGLIKAGWFSKKACGTISLNGTSANFSIVTSPKSRRSIIKNDLKRTLGIGVQTNFFAELRHFVDCLQNDVRPSPSGEEALLDIKIISMAYENSHKLF